MVALRQHEVLITFDDFVRMDADGYFGEARHLELIDGRIYALSPVSLHHARGQSRLERTLDRMLAAHLSRLDAEVIGQATLQIDDLNGPEFDAAVIRSVQVDYVRPQDVLLVAEVTLSSRNRDLKHKPSVYARAGVPEYWAAERRKKQLHVFRDPVEGEYRTRLLPLGPDDVIAPLFAPDIAIPVRDLL